VTQGREIGQLALLFGANDMGSLMIEENVVSAAGTVHHLTLDEMKASIAQLGWIPRRRNVFYELFEEEPVAAVPAAPSWAVMLPVATAVS
jgi:cyclic dehypoxanthinyl futalosine synthase